MSYRTFASLYLYFIVKDIQAQAKLISAGLE